MLTLLSQCEGVPSFEDWRRQPLYPFRKIRLRDVFASASTGKNLSDLHVRPPAVATLRALSWPSMASRLVWSVLTRQQGTRRPAGRVGDDAMFLSLPTMPQ
jgi:hypothetical protein